MDMVDFLSISVTLCPRYAVSPTQATRHRWREDHHSEPNRPTKVPLSRAEYYRPILRENQSCGVFMILIQCVSHPVTKNLKTLPHCPHLVRCVVIKLLLFVRKDHEKAEFEVHEVYAVDVLISTGEGKVSISLCCW